MIFYRIIYIRERRVTTYCCDIWFTLGLSFCVLCIVQVKKRVNYSFYIERLSMLYCHMYQLSKFKTLSIGLFQYIWYPYRKQCLFTLNSGVVRHSVRQKILHWFFTLYKPISYRCLMRELVFCYYLKWFA